MNFPNNAQMRFIMSNRYRLLESGGGGGGSTGVADSSRRRYGQGPSFGLHLCGDQVSSFLKRARGVLRATGITLPRWQLWVLGILIYFCLAVVLEPVAEELMAEEERMTLYEWVKENEADLRSEYKERVEQAHDICNRYDVYMTQLDYIRSHGNNQEAMQYSDWFTLKRVNWNYMYYVPQEDFVYCKVPKSGSTTWVYNLLKLANVPEEQISSDIGIHKLLRDYYPKMSSSKMKQAFKKSFKLLVVRHPFERILSAYRDKLENYQRDLMFRDGYYYTMYGKTIVQVYRDETDLSLKNRTEPTWTEFVRYVINTPYSKFDEHWKPIYSLCSPCVIKYNVIAKMETFSEDTQFVINQLGLEDQLHVEWIHRTANDRTSDVANLYYSQLTRRQVDQLYAKYKLDFELFDYNHEAYREMAKQ
ncbi:carbohydrate sulfotransferase 11-like [Macrobrachium nipponense]|uniref:carbohydrate sulfotransferase 11-like n=1 Tax=Macrobrachium nipponense TaxID=159736 RepID=UPI0030C8C016